MEKPENISLIKIEAIVREEAYQDVKNALSEIGVNGCLLYTSPSPRDS